MKTLRWTRTDEYDFTDEDLERAQADFVDLSDPEALFWWLNPQGTRWPVMTRPVVEEYEFADRWGPPTGKRYGLQINWSGTLSPVELFQGGSITPGRRKPTDRCPLGHSPSPVPGDLMCDCGAWVYASLSTGNPRRRP